MNVSIGAKTDPGRRPNNEDQHAVVDVRRHRLRADGVLVVADGMGGRNGGEKAAAAAVETVQDALADMLDLARDEGVPVGDALDTALRKANARVYEMSQAEEGSQGMGTTCVAAVIEGEALHVAHAGDSRAYLLHDGQLERLTNDHSYVAEQVRAGMITEDGARRSRFRNVITRAVGIEPTIKPDVGQFELRPGDYVLLCTDGLTNMVAEDTIAQTLAESESAQSAAERLVQMANQNGGRDNITAVVAHLEIGTRTQKMRAGDLAAASQASHADARNGEPAQSAPPAAPPGRESSAAAARPNPRPAAGRGRRPVRRGISPGWVVLCLLLTACLGAGSVFFGHVLLGDGYVFQTAPPWVFKPTPPPPPPPPDLASASYEAPILLFVKPVRGSALARAADGTLIVQTLSGWIIRLSADGKLLSQTRSPQGVSAAATLPGPHDMDTLHFATDPQGNLYVADAQARVITKYRTDRGPARTLGRGDLQRPQALAVGDDSSVFVIDAERLKVFRAHPGQTPAPAHHL